MSARAPSVRRSIRLLTLLGLFLASSSAPARTATAAQTPPASRPAVEALRYEIRPVPRADRTELKVTVRFKPADGGPVRIRLPRDYYGTPDLYRYVTSIEGFDGTRLEPAAPTDADKAADPLGAVEEAYRLVHPGEDGAVAIRYVLSYDPAALDGYAFAPNVGPRHFHVAGCQFMLGVGDLDERRLHEIAILDAPREWTLYASRGADPADVRMTASYRELISSALGGGDGPHRRYDMEGRPFDVFLYAGLELPEAEVFDAVERTVRTQRERMQDFDQPFYHVVLLPRGGVIAGTSIPNLFVCFLKKDITREQLYVHLAHEMFHKWLPNELAIAPPEGHTSMRHEWFSEGVTDYLARRLLLDAEVISRELYVELVNRDLLNLADSPARAATYDDLLRAAEEGRFTSTYKKLAYYRGAVIGLNWEARLRRAAAEAGGGTELIDVIRDMHRQARATGGAFEEEAFFDEMARRGLDVRGAFERHVLRGDPIVPESDALEPEYRLEMQSIPAWDPGFDLDATLRARKITNLRRGGPAERAGLAEGLPVVRMANSGRFANNWDPKRPLTVVVEIEGEPRTFRYFPHGEPRPVPQFVPRIE